MTVFKRKKNRKTCVLGSENFDENIIFNILKRVEADTLYNLRVVCKQWYNLIILDPQFAATNLSYAKPGIMLQMLVYGSYKLGFVEMEGGEILVRDLNLTFENPVIASCNGLVLLTEFPKFDDLSVVNLVTRKAMKVPLSLAKFSGKVLKVFGFTYIPQTSEYKIVCYIYDKNLHYCVYKILTFGSNEWRQVKGPQPRYGYAKAISINSFVHSLIREGDQDFLFSIDTADETSHKSTALPYRKVTDRYLVDLGGVLSYLINFGNSIEVWVIEDFYKKEWIRRHFINPHLARFYHHGGFKDYIPIGSLENGRIILFVVRVRNVDFGECYAVDFKLQKVKKISAKASRNFCKQHLNSLISSESL